MAQGADGDIADGRVARIGLVGFGVAGSAFHAPLIHTTPGLELAAVVVRDPGRAAAVRARYPGAEVVPAVEDLWRLGLDAVTLATPNATHVPLALSAIEDGGVGVVVDKPLAPTAEQGRQLVAAAAARGVPLTVYLNRRWDGDFLTVQQLVADGALGSIRRFESRFERWRPDVVDSWKERAAPGEAGGILFDLGPHLIDQAVQLFGPVSQVYAEVAATRTGATNADDVFLALRHSAGGVLSHLYASAVAADLGPRFRLLGDAGGYSVRGLDPQEAQLRSGADPSSAGAEWGRVPPASWGVRSGAGGDSGGGESPVRVPTRPGDYGEFYRRWAATLLEGAPVPVDPSDAVYGLTIVEAAVRASSDRLIVAVGP
ncbi:MAG: oxidoreductase [Actinobacteria bacterium]|nr:MAG: oxidoreductase [Actinomycetota bacterium]